jgi:Zn-dependent M28 family amino/carboxypeptidase
LDTFIKAVNKIFGAITSCIIDEKQREKMNHIHPSLEPENFCFRFMHMHTDVIQYQAAKKKIESIIISKKMHDDKRAKEDPQNIQAMQDLDEERNELVKKQIEIMQEYNKFDQTKIQALANESDVINGVLAKIPRLYICVDDDYELSEHEMYARLPVATSRAFRNENEKTELEKLKESVNA